MNILGRIYKLNHMAKCWAESLGGCSSKMTREHTISRSVFTGDAVKVQGFPWCKVEPVTIGLGSLVKKSLCARHNNDLSDVDSEAGRVYSQLREMTRLSEVRRKLGPRRWSTIPRYKIDGLKLERWLLKTLINIAYGEGHPVGTDAARVEQLPSDRLVQTAFGLSVFKEPAGLYFLVTEHLEIRFEDHLLCTTVINDKHTAGALFSVYGLPVMLWTEQIKPPAALSGLKFQGDDLGGRKLLYRVKGIRETTGLNRLSQKIHFTWL